MSPGAADDRSIATRADQATAATEHEREALSARLLVDPGSHVHGDVASALEEGERLGDRSERAFAGAVAPCCVALDPDLGRVARAGTVRITQAMDIERYSHVMHMVSNVACDLEEGRDALDVLRAAFPAGTLTGAPKVRAMQIIDALEPEPRGIYGGAVGYVGFDGNLDMAIAIRTVLAAGGDLILQAGAGIVEASDPRAEYEETVAKARAGLLAVAAARRGS